MTAQQQIRMATVTHVETAFQRHAKKPGGKPKAMALADAQKAVESLSSMGTNLISSNIELLRRIGSDLKEGTGDQAALIAEAYARSVETAEVASFFRMTALTDVACQLNELLFRMRESGTFAAESYDVHVEALRMMSSARSEAQSDTNTRVLTEHLKKVVDRLPDPDAGLA